MKNEKREKESSPSHNSLRTSLNWEVLCFVLVLVFSWLLWYFDKRKLRKEEGRVYSAQGSGTEAAGHIHDTHIWEAESSECMLLLNLCLLLSPPVQLKLLKGIGATHSGQVSYLNYPNKLSP